MDFKWDPEGKWRLTDREATLTLPSQEIGNEIERLPPQASIHNIRSLDITGWILQRTDKTTEPNNSVLGR